MAKILVVDDEEIMRDLAMDCLAMSGHTCVGAPNVRKGLELLASEDPDLIVSDFKMPEFTGLDFLKEVQQKAPGLPFIIMTAYGTIETAVEAMKFGASDFIEKPFQPEILEMTVERVLETNVLRKENTALKKELQSRHKFVGGSSEEYRRLDEMLSDVADSVATILIMGESGVGKEVLARNVHNRSTRASGPFVKINCAALPENLIESELFGHEKGAFTGALKTKKGKFELADGGTLLLDEIGEMPLAAQAKLLRVLQEREVSRVGGDKEFPVNVRVVCTTNRNLEEEVEAGNFREDLFYRLNVIPVEIQPLRKRLDDIDALVEHFINKFNNEYGYSVEGLDPEARKAVLTYEWPGNIRQLENAVERAMVFSKAGLIPAERFQFVKKKVTNEASASGLEAGMTVADAERALIIKTLEHCEGNKTRTAEMLDISIRTLRNKLNDYGDVD